MNLCTLIHIFPSLSSWNQNTNFWFLSSESSLQTGECKFTWLWFWEKHQIPTAKSYEYLSVAVIKNHSFFLLEFLSKQFQNVIPSVNVFWKQHEPSFLSSGVIFTFVSVISLNEARKRTTSPFSFFMGTISNRHQNGDPATAKEKHFNHCLLLLYRNHVVRGVVYKVLSIFF